MIDNTENKQFRVARKDEDGLMVIQDEDSWFSLKEKYDPST